MTPPAWLANENVPAPALLVLREAGIEVIAVAETMRSASDREVLTLLDNPDALIGHLSVVTDRSVRRRALPSL